MKNKVLKRLLGVMSCMCILAVILTGCGKKSGDDVQTDHTVTGKTESGNMQKEAKEGSKTEINTYPLNSDKTLVYWGNLRPNVAPNFTNVGDTHIGQQWQRQVGVKIEFQHPTAGQESEQFNLILADGTYPDLWDYDWRNFPGGPTKALDDGVILELNDLIDQYCPNLKAYLEANPEIDRGIKTDDGRYYSFPTVRDVYASYLGPMLRADWLKELGLSVPETIDEWHTVLTAFKEQKGAIAPFTTGNKSDTFFSYAYGVQKGFFLDDGNIVYGPSKKEYKDYLKTMARWYAEGLLDPDLYASAEDQTTAKITTGRAGSTTAWAASGLMNFISIGQSSDSNYDLVAAKYPVLNKGDTPEYGYIENPYYYGGYAIGATCKDPVLAAKVLDYGYGEEGHMMFNFGEEGISYTMVDGFPTYTDMVWKNPNGWPVSQAIANYIFAYSQGPMVQDFRYQSQYLYMDQAKAAVETWKINNAKEHLLPNITRSSEESTVYARIMNDISTYVDEMSSKFIMGMLDIDSEFDNYVKTLNDMELEQAVEITKAAYMRYQQR